MTARRGATVQAGANAARQALATAGDRELTATFCFVDIAGYTALTDSHGERAAADLVDLFTDMVRKAVDGRGKVQELSGDNAFLVFPDPVVAMQAVAALYGGIAGVQDLPMLRAGLHHGTALCRGDRFFGSTINIAARASAQAAGGEIMCTASVAQALALSGTADFSVGPVGLVKLKNLQQQVDLYRVTLSNAAPSVAIDPVCQMQVDTRNAAAHAASNGTRYWFCSSPCLHRFLQDPTAFV